MAQAARGEAGRLALESLAEAGAPADRIAEAAGIAHKSAATLFRDHHPLLGQHGYGAPHRVAVGGKAFRQNGFGGQTVTARQLAADNVEANRIGNAAP